jgi:hypothetical protein
VREGGTCDVTEDEEEEHDRVSFMDFGDTGVACPDWTVGGWVS